MVRKEKRLLAVRLNAQSRLDDNYSQAKYLGKKVIAEETGNEVKIKRVHGGLEKVVEQRNISVQVSTAVLVMLFTIFEVLRLSKSTYRIQLKSYSGEVQKK